MSEIIPSKPSSIVRRAQASGALDLNGETIFAAETRAAQQSIACGIYVIWAPHPSASIPASASDEIKSGLGQCCRIGPESHCLCGHALSSHHAPKIPKRPGYIKPPTCSSCKKCSGFSYSPSFPEECGQWWLKRRRDFHIIEWRKRVQQHPEEYACIGCNLKVTDHETIIETRDQRASRGATVDGAYIPLAEYRTIEEGKCA